MRLVRYLASKDVPGATHFLCARCRKIQPTESNSGTGYGYPHNPEGEYMDKLHCYACCGQTDKLAMLRDGKATMYLTGEKLTNWPGSLSFQVQYTRKLNHPFSRRAVIAYFRGPDGKQWSAKNIGDTEIAHCRRLAS
jgi:hypothetical protein